MDIVRQGTVGKDFLVHTGYNLTGWNALKLRFVKPDNVTYIEVEDPDVTVSGADADGDLAFTDTGMFPTSDGAAGLGIWTIIAIVEKTGLVMPSAPSGKFRVIGEFAAE